jgi:hypothetical protein
VRACSLQASSTLVCRICSTQIASLVALLSTRPPAPACLGCRTLRPGALPPTAPCGGARATPAMRSARHSSPAGATCAALPLQQPDLPPDMLCCAAYNGAVMSLHLASVCHTMQPGCSASGLLPHLSRLPAPAALMPRCTRCWTRLSPTGCTGAGVVDGQAAQRQREAADLLHHCCGSFVPTTHLSQRAIQHALIALTPTCAAPAAAGCMCAMRGWCRAAWSL